MSKPSSRGRIGTSLSRREREILRRLCQGWPNKIIARELNMAEGTCEAHVRRIMKKINARSRTDVLLFAGNDLSNCRNE